MVLQVHCRTRNAWSDLNFASYSSGPGWEILPSSEPPQPTVQGSHSTLWIGNKTVSSSGQGLFSWFMFAIKHLLLKLIKL